jgi:hypothetical protein
MHASLARILVGASGESIDGSSGTRRRPLTDFDEPITKSKMLSYVRQGKHELITHEVISRAPDLPYKKLGPKPSIR